jgi:superoxide dismutase, Fe-Mn family
LNTGSLFFLLYLISQNQQIMKRKYFIKTGIILGGASMLPVNSVFSQNLAENGNFIQLPLPYSTSFLEPHMDEETLHLHYTFHHGGAVKAANKDMENLKKIMDSGNFELSDFWTKKLAFHFSSHILHSIFWTNLTNKKNEPAGQLLKRIESNFGSFDKLKGLLAAVSKSVDGSGWGILGYQPYSDKLTVLQCENHEKLTQWGVVPLLIIDVWEHAYYLKFKNKRDQFVDGIFDIINWDNVAQRLDIALTLK